MASESGRKRIMAIIPGGLPPGRTYGSIPALIALFDRLVDRHDLSVISLDQSPRFGTWWSGQVPVTNLGGRPGWRGLSTKTERLQDTVGHHTFDIVHSFWNGIPALLGRYVATCSGAAFGVTIGGQEMRGPYRGIGGRPYSAMLTALARSADWVTAGSDFVTASLVRVRQDVHVIPLFSDIPLIQRPPRPAGDFPQLVTVASINAVKDPWTMLKALAILRSRKFECRLSWIGQDTLAGNAQRLASELGVADLVDFIGFLPHDQVLQQVAWADAYVVSSAFESQCVAACEAASLGVPVVGTHVGILADWAPDGAITAPTGNPAALADAIQHSLDPHIGRSTADIAVQFLRDRGPDWTANQFDHLYQTGKVRTP